MEAGAAEPPAALWGLDPLFSAFARLFIRDIRDMAESTQVPGIYFYNSHPIYKVDVFGVVVYKRERDDFFCYGVDDGTGVVNCLCWKSDLMKEEEPPGPACGPAPRGGGFDVAAELRALRRVQQARRRLDIGELLRVRGSVKTSRQQREVVAATFYKVEDPRMAAQIRWMTEVLELYRRCYDRRRPLQPAAPRRSPDSPVTAATDVLQDFLKQDSVSRFRPADVLDLLQPLVRDRQPAAAGPDPTGPPPEEVVLSPAPSVREPVPGPSGSQRLRQLLDRALQVLQDRGVVYRRVRSPDPLYHVTVRDKDLLTAVQDVIREDCRRERYSDTGCHVLHVLSAVRQRHSLNVSRAALQLALQALECSSDIISTSDDYYTAF